MLPEQFIPLLRGNVLVFTGAGISAASGIPTFRGDDGLYEGLNPYELASPGAFKAHPVTVWNWYLMRIHQGKGAQPNPAHCALAELETTAENVNIVTSNVDPLHRRAGSKNVFQLHGDILQRKCSQCDFVEDIDLGTLPVRVDDWTLPRCSCGAVLRPNVVWFGEYPWSEAVEVTYTELPRASVVLEVGSSGVVSYGFSEMAAHKGVPVVRINPEARAETGITAIAERAEVALPLIVDQVKQAH